MGRRTNRNHRGGSRTRGSNSKPKGQNHRKLFGLILVFILAGIIMLFTLVDQKVTNIAKVNDAEVDQRIKAEGSDLIIEEKDGYTLKPNYREPTKGLILYGDAGVSPKAYVPLGMLLAQKGYLVVIPSFLLNSPDLDGQTIKKIISDHNEITLWAVAGHGSGGEAMSGLLESNPKVKGAIFLASYPGDKVDLSKSSLRFVSITGTMDHILDKETYEARKSKLPANTMFVKIEGGNYAYFANYADDSAAEISRNDQQIQASVQIQNLLDQLK